MMRGSLRRIRRQALRRSSAWTRKRAPQNTRQSSRTVLFALSVLFRAASIWTPLAAAQTGTTSFRAGSSGLPFSRLPLGLRAEFTRLAYGRFARHDPPGLAELIDSSLRVEYKPISRKKTSQLPSDSSAVSSIGHRLNDDGTLTPIAVTPQPPMLRPDWKLKFIYTFGSKRTGKSRRIVSPGGFSVSLPGEIID